jgi:hypothetical protein
MLAALEDPAATATGVWICPRCDYAEKHRAGPPIPTENLRDAEPTP